MTTRQALDRLGAGIRGERRDGPAAPLPDFLVLGAQKCGTSWLARRLGQHPDLYLPPREIHYFNHADHLSRGLDWYRAQFREAPPDAVVGEKTPNYLWVTERPYGPHLPGVHRYVHAALPGARLVVVLREPIARALSSLRHQVRSGRVPAGDVDELLVGRDRGLAEAQGVHDMGRYMVGIDAYLELYEREQLLLLIFEEDVVADPASGLRRVCQFLDVDPDFAFDRLQEPVGDAARSRGRRGRLRPRPAELRGVPRPSTIQTLREFYREDNERLFAFLGRVPRGWGEGSVS